MPVGLLSKMYTAQSIPIGSKRVVNSHKELVRNVGLWIGKSDPMSTALLSKGYRLAVHICLYRLDPNGVANSHKKLVRDVDTKSLDCNPKMWIPIVYNVVTFFCKGETRE